MVIYRLMMKRVFSYLKPYRLSVFICIFLLTLQALGELMLPNLLAKIVNTGLVNSGIDSPAPVILTPSDLKKVLIFAGSSEEKVINSHYSLVDSMAFKQFYPNAIGKVYVKMTADDELDYAFAKAAYALMSYLTASDSEFGKFDIDNVDGASLAASLKSTQMVERETIEKTAIEITRQILVGLGTNMANVQTNYILKIGNWMLGITLLVSLVTILLSFLSSKLSSGFGKDLRAALFSKIESFSNTEFDRFSSSSLITRCTVDVNQIQALIMLGIQMMCYAPLAGIGGIIMALRTSVSMSWLIVVSCICMIILVLGILSYAFPKFQLIQTLIDKLNRVTRENLSGLFIIRAFNKMEHENTRFDKASEELSKTNLQIFRVMAFMQPIMMAILNWVTLLIIWVGSDLIATNKIQIGDVLAYMQYALQIITSFVLMSMIFLILPKAMVAIRRLQEVLTVESSIKDPENPVSLTDVSGEVALEGVSFKYEGGVENAITDVSFTAEPGKVTAIVGSTGSGKSTIAHLILRLYDPIEGSLSIDGVNLKEMSQEALHEFVSFVPQNASLLSGSIRENLRLGSDYDEEVLKAALENASAWEFIEKFEEGMDHEVSRKAGNLSGGQRQRLTIARAILKDSRVMIIDDSFSALDFSTASQVLNALRKLWTDKTVVMITQRISTIMNADKIVVMENGGVVGIGKHSELLKTCKVYYEMALSQMNREELIG
jgi:ATP-binding cassette subfamily B protein